MWIAMISLQYKLLIFWIETWHSVELDQSEWKLKGRGFKITQGQACFKIAQDKIIQGQACFKIARDKIIQGQACFKINWRRRTIDLDT